MNIEPTVTPEDNTLEPVAMPQVVPSAPETPAPSFAQQIPAHEDVAPVVVTASSPVAAFDEPVGVGNLGLYLVRMLSGVSLLASTSYLTWTLLNYFLSEPSEFMFFDLSTLNLYVLIYGALFGAVYVITSMRLDRAQKDASAFGRPQQVASAVWQAVLVVWGITALASLMYAPISAATAGDASGKNIAIEVLSSLYALGMTVLLFWHDKRLVKAQANLVPTAVLGVVLVGILVAVTITTMNPKQVKSTDSYDYNSSMFDSSSGDSTTDSTTDANSEFNLDTYNTGTDTTSN